MISDALVEEYISSLVEVQNTMNREIYEAVREKLLPPNNVQSIDVQSIRELYLTYSDLKEDTAWDSRGQEKG